MKKSLFDLIRCIYLYIAFHLAVGILVVFTYTCLISSLMLKKSFENDITLFTPTKMTRQTFCHLPISFYHLPPMCIQHLLYKICELWHLPGGGVGGIGTVFGLDLPNVVNAVELTPNNTMNTPNNIVKLPHCVKRFNGCILDHKIYWLSILLSVQKLSLTISL